MPGDFRSRRFAGQADLEPLRSFASDLAAARPPCASYYHPGDVTWQLYRARATDDVRIWHANGQVVAVGVFEPPLTFQFDAHPAFDVAGVLTSEILAWAEQRRGEATAGDIPIAYQMLGDRTISTTALAGDDERVASLGCAAYTPVERHAVRFSRALERTIPGPTLSGDARLRRAEDADVAARAALHRAAWSVWGRSTFTANAYRRLRRAPGYDAGLDVVVELDGLLVSYCVCWLDEASSIGYIEPAGTRPSHARRGFGKEAILEGLRRMRDRGMRFASVQTASVNEAANALYRSCGFEVVAIERFYVKRLSG